jgi:hypothetical protein
VDVSVRRGFERHVGGGLGLGKGEGRGERRRVPFKHELAYLLIDELGKKLLGQGEVVVDLFAWVRAVGCRGLGGGRAILRRPQRRSAWQYCTLRGSRLRQQAA